MAYDPNIDYQTVINNAVAKGDYKAAAVAEATRKEKIDAMNAAGTNTKGYTATNLYAGNLDTVDRGTILRQALDSGASAEEVSQFLNDRTNKANSAVNLNQYANDALAQEAAAYIKQQNQAPSTVSGVQQLKPELSGQALGDKYGLTYDMGQIKGILDKATQGIYDNKNEAFKTTENNFYNQMGGLQAESIDALKKTQAQAVATGASKGMAAANELSAILGLQETAAPIANDLGNQRNLLATEEAGAYSKNAATALDTSNSIKQAIANLDLTKYGYDTQESIGIMDYLAALQDTAATKDASAKTLEGVKYNADANLAGTKYNSDGYNKNSSGSGSGSGSDAGASPTGTSSDNTPVTAEDVTHLSTLDTKIKDSPNGTYYPGGNFPFSMTGNQTDGYVINGIVDPTDGATKTVTLNASQMNTLSRNNWDYGVISDPKYGQSDYTTKGEVKTAQEAAAYYNKNGKAPAGWQLTNVGRGGYEWQESGKTPKVNISGINGQKVSVASIVWTYDKASSTWSNKTGTSKLTQAQFKTYMDEHGNASNIKDVT